MEAGDKWMLVTSGFWSQVDVGGGISILVTSFGCSYPTSMLKDTVGDVGDEDGKNRHDHLKVVAFRHQHPTPTSV